MGRLHARVYSQMPQVKLIGVYDANPETAAAVAEEYNCNAFTRLDDVLPHDGPGGREGRALAVTIAVPTKFHADVAERCLASRVACLVEKPLAKDVADAAGLSVRPGGAARRFRWATLNGSTPPSAR